MTTEPVTPAEPEVEHLPFIRDDDDNLTALGPMVLDDASREDDIPDLVMTLVAFTEDRDRGDVLALLKAITGRYAHAIERIADASAKEMAEWATEQVAAQQQPAADVAAVAALAQRSGRAQGAREGYQQGRADGVAAAAPQAAVERVERDPQSGRPVAIHSEFPDGTTRSRRISYGEDGKLATIATVTESL